MLRLFTTTLFAFFLTTLTAQQDASSLQYLQTTGQPTGQVEELKRILTGVDIIGLGEPTHGMADVFRTRAELVRVLHEELGYDLLLMEVGYGDAGLAYQHVQELSGEDLMRQSSSYQY